MKSKPTRPADAVAPGTLDSPLQGSVLGAWHKHHLRLVQMREKVIQDATDLSTEVAAATTPSGTNPADAASDSFDRDLALGLLSFEQNALNEIDEALTRIQEGRYGICELTGEPIPRQRLEAIPWTRYTVEAQAKMERANETSHAHLGAVGSVRTQRQN